MIKRICKNCSAPYKIYPYMERINKGFCSNKCYQAYRKNKIINKCLNCGKLINTVKSTNKKFCNKECYSIWQQFNFKPKNKNQIEIKCKICGNYFKVSLSRKDTKTCSFSCYQKLRSESVSKEKHPKWKGGGREVKCSVCGKVKEITLLRFKKGKPFYCSTSCATSNCKSIRGVQLGRNKERELKNKLINDGFYVMKSAGSLGAFDLIAINNSEIKLIQTKSTRNCWSKNSFKKDIKRMKEIKTPNNCVKELWVWEYRKSWKILKI